VRLLAFWVTHRADMLAMLERHLFLVAASTSVAVAVGVPAGIVAAHRPRLGRPLIAVANIAQTIPSLALLGFLLPIPYIGGVGPRAAVAALIVYALLPIVRTTAAGLRSLDPAVLEAGVAMGMTPRQLLWLVEIPLALPSLIAGIRVATVVGVGTATIAAAIGAGGFGELIFRGLSMVDGSIILAGAIPAALLAVIADAALTWLERRLSPGRRSGPARRHLALVAAAVLGAVLVTSATPPWGRGAVVIGSKNFTEQVLLGELLAQTLERQGIPVTRKLNLGGTFICDRAVRAGDLDAYVEYTGTALTAIFHEPAVHGGDAVLARTRELYARAGVSELPPLGFNNTFAILVRRHDAEARRLRTISDLAAVSPGWTAAFGYEFLERADGYGGLSAAYGLRFARPPRAMDLALMYRALAEREVDVIAGDATSALIDALDLERLADDKEYFPPYHAVPVVRTALLLARPEVGAALSALAGRVSERQMRTMNHAVDVKRLDVSATVRDFLDSAR
jgi:osmoprotectant transport system permease protein